jgi:hypothetical protein
MWPKSRFAVVGSVPEEECNRRITPESGHNAQTHLLIQNCQTSEKIRFSFFIAIKNALVWCHVVQK